jgi:integration host factor subunit beta
LISFLMQEQTQLDERDAQLAIKAMLERMTAALAAGERIEIRGFGSFSLHFRAPRIGHIPKTGKAVAVAARYVAHFKPGKALRERVRGRKFLAHVGTVKLGSPRLSDSPIWQR